MSKEKKDEVGEPEKPSLILYTDGGCRPSRGRGGYGFHGYLYANEKPKQGAGAKAVPTKDGYVVGAKDKAVTVLNYIDCCCPHEDITTNNLTEMDGVKQAMLFAMEKDVAEFIIFTDSKYVMKGLEEWLPGWIKRNWTKADGEPVSNCEEWKQLLEVKNKLEATDIKFEIRKVRGHSGDLGNDCADQLASAAVIMAHNGVNKKLFKISDAKGYWTKKVEYNRLLSKPYWYFLAGNAEVMATPCERFAYYLGSHGPKDELLGKPMSDASYVVVYLKEPDSVLAHVRAAIDAKAVMDNQVIIGRLSNITTPDNYSAIDKHGDALLSVNDDKLDCTNHAGVSITTEQTPSRLAYRMLEAMNIMDDILKSYIAGSKEFVVTDITDNIFDKEEKKGKVVCKIKKEMSVSTRYIDVDAEYQAKNKADSIDVRLLLGMDLPDRNTLAALAPKLPSVKVITWKESDEAFRFATIVETGDDVGIFSSFYSNLRLLID